MFNFILDYSKESLGSEEESGKDWDELEEEARKGKFFIVCCLFLRHRFLADFSILSWYLPNNE